MVSDILGLLAFIFIVVSMHQENIIKLRLWRALSGVCFLLQFSLIGNMFINVIGQLGLVIYGLYKAYREVKEKKSAI